MPTPIQPLIREFRDGDTSAVIALWNRLLPDNAPHNDPGRAIRQKLAADADLFFVAVVGSAVVGTVMGGYDGHRGWVYSLAVAPEHQRRGIASALIAHLEDALAARGCLKVNLQVRASNEGVVEFYRKCGYQIEERVSLGKRLYGENAE